MFQKGQLIKWHETYGDVYITKDCGMGVVVEINEYDFFEKPYFTYRIYRTEHSDYMIFEEHNLEKFKEKQNELQTI